MIVGVVLLYVRYNPTARERHWDKAYSPTQSTDNNPLGGVDTSMDEDVPADDTTNPSEARHPIHTQPMMVLVDAFVKPEDMTNPANLAPYDPNVHVDHPVEGHEV